MLTFAMATRDEGPELELALRALAQVSGPGDSLLVFHAGDDRNLTRLQGFAAEYPTRIIQTDSPVGGHRDLLRLALEMAETDYTLVLSPSDRLQPEALETLRKTLAQATPDLCLLHSAWWLADASAPLPRSDSAVFGTLPAEPTAPDCSDLLPDPRRLVYRTDHWLARLATWPAEPDARSFYKRVLADSATLSVMRTPTLLHAFTPTDPTPVLRGVTNDLSERTKGERTACLAGWLPTLDEALTLCPPGQSAALLGALPGITALLPRQLRQGMARQPGPFARLLEAQITEGPLGAKATLSLQLSQQQQHRSDLLAAAYGRLRADLDLALPGPAYLHDLYTRLRAL